MVVSQLQEYGIEQMDDDDIEEFVSSQSTGVLGLPADEAPYMLPMSYSFDGDSSLYFTYLLGPSSQKETLSGRADRVRFLVYAAETKFHWRSVLLTGTLSTVSEREYAELENKQASGWRPEVLQSASTSGELKLYEFSIQDQTGLRHVGLPSGFRENA